MKLNQCILMASQRKILRKFNEQRDVQQFVVERENMINLTVLSQELSMITRYNEKGIVEYPFVL